MLGFGPISDAPLAALSGAVRTFANTHLTQTLIRLTASRQHNASSFLKAGLIDVHQTMAVLRVGLTDTHQARSVLRAGFTDAHLTNSLLKAGFTDTHLTNSLLKAGLTDTHLTNSLLKAGLTDTHLTNSLLKAGLTDEHQARSVLRAGFTDTHITNSTLRAGITDTHQTRSLLKTVFSDTHLTNSFLRLGLSDSHQARSLFIAGFSDAHLTNSLLKSAITRTHQTIALISAAGVIISHQTLAALKLAQTVSQNSQALVKQSQSKSHATDGNRLKLSLISSSSGGFLKKTGTTKKLAMLIGIGDGPPLSGYPTTYDQSLLILYNDGSSGFISTPFRTMRNPSGNLLPGRKEVYYDTQYKQWIAIANDFSSNRVYTSNNGVDWVKTSAGRTVGSTIVVSGAINGLSYGNGNTVLAVLGDYAGTAGILSYNGTSWTTTWPSALESGVYGTNFANIAFLNGKFLAYTNANLMATSTDGVTWTSVPSPFTGVRNLGSEAMYGLATDGSYFYAIGTDNASHYDSVYKSSDGVNWTLVNSSIGLSAYSSTYFSAGLTYFNGYFRTSVYGLGGYYSADLINWTPEVYTPIAYDYYNNSIVASNSFRPVGTLYKASSYAGTWTALPAVSGIDGIGIGAAGYYGADTLNMITNMLIKITSSKSHNTSTLFRSTFLESHNTSSFFKAAQSKTQQARALLKALLSMTHNANALLRDTFSNNHNSNALLAASDTIKLHQARSMLRAVLTETHITNSLLRDAGISVTHLTNSVLKAGLTDFHQAVSVLRAGLTETHITNSLLKAGLTETHLTNSILKAGLTDFHQAVSVLRAGLTDTHFTNSLLRGAGIVTHLTNSILKAERTETHQARTVLRAGLTDTHFTNSLLRGAGTAAHLTNSLLKAGLIGFHQAMSLLRTAFSDAHLTSSLLRVGLSDSHQTRSLLKIANKASDHYVDAGLMAVGLKPHLVNGFIRQTFNLSNTTQTQTIMPLKKHNTSGLKITTSSRAHSTAGLVRNSYDLSQVLSYKLIATDSVAHTTFTRLYSDDGVIRQHNNNSLVLGAFAADHNTSFLTGSKSQTAVHYATALLLRFNEAVVRNVFKAFRSESIGKFIPFVVDQQRSDAVHTNRIVLRQNGWSKLDIAAKETLLNNKQVDYRNTCSKVDIIARVGDTISPDIRAIWGACLDNIDHSATPGFVAQDLAAPGVAPLLEPVVLEPPKPRQIFNNVNISPIRVKRGPESKASEPAPIVIQRAIQDAPAPATIPRVTNFGEVKKKSPPPKIWKNTEKILKMPR